jgi:hypothetical protein
MRPHTHNSTMMQADVDAVHQQMMFGNGYIYHIQLKQCICR